MNNSNDAVLSGNNYREERIENMRPVREQKKGLYFSTIVAGIFAAVAMAVIAFFLGEMQVDAIVIMFAKYIVLIPVIVWALVKQRNILGTGYKFVKGIRQGGLVSLVTATTMAVTNVFLYNTGASLETGNTTEPSSYLGSAFINGGVVFMECIVMGMIITFICLQFIKKGRPGEESLSDASA